MTTSTLKSDVKVTFDQLETLYGMYNHREFVHPDPLEFLFDYPDPKDREIVGLIASSLAYGSVWQILKTVRLVLDRIGKPCNFVTRTQKSKILKTFKDFKYRFTTGEELGLLLYGIGKVVKSYGSLENCFKSGITDEFPVLGGMSSLVDSIQAESGGDPRCFYHLLPHPSRKSACKRLNLFLRWMVRSDEVDPGGWYTVPPDKLLVPLDVHMFRICRALGLTSRGSADIRAAVEITGHFRDINPDDPVKYDFALTRLGIRDELHPNEFIRECLEKNGGETTCKNTKDS